MAKANDIAFEIKERVSCREFAEFMGLRLDAKGFAVCPFHGDRDASFKVYGDGRGWCCFGCHKGGDVINMAREFYGLGFTDTLRQIDSDFDLKLYENLSPVRRAGDLGAMKRLLSERKRQKDEDERRETEKAFLDALDSRVTVNGLVWQLHPRRQNGELLKAYALALRKKQELDIRLDDAEGRWQSVCWRQKQAEAR